jgi:hypothetical protein
MAAISWNEVRDLAIKFSRAWAGAASERADKQTFWNEFFEVFGVRRRTVASFEEPVTNIRGHYGAIDLFWPGVLLVEHKSAGKKLDAASSQAFAYVRDLAREGRHDECPRYIVVSDFAHFALYDLEPEDQRDLPLFDNGRAYTITIFSLADLHKHARDFAFIRGEKPLRLDPENPANMAATKLLADLHDNLEEAGYSGHALERYLVRILFCLFAEDTGIFEPQLFTQYVRTRTREDGSDLGPMLAELFDVLDTPENKRMRGLNEDLAAFPYVNGALFSEPLRSVAFNRQLREALLKCCRFQWARISPAVFGSLFQGIMDARERRALGAHYTSERDIMKLLRGLMLDELRAKLDAALADRSTRRTERLRDFQSDLRRLRIFDPACGCGNFLILAYREIRRLETEALVALYSTRQGGRELHLNVRELAQVDVDQFYGIEIQEWPARIAEVGLWLTDHQCNLELAEALGQSFNRLPLRAAPTIRVANALRTEWSEVLAPTDNVSVLGNPPFVGHQWRTAEQQADMDGVWGTDGRFGRLDYVTAWYRKAADYIRGTRIRCAFVSTNSITQGEQVGIMWGDLFTRGIKIHFGHRTFSWISEAKGKAKVHVVIIGFGHFEAATKRLYDYDADPTEASAVVSECANISPYLIAGPDLVLPSRTDPRPGMPTMTKGSQPTDGGHLVLSPQERVELLAVEPAAAVFLRPYIGSEELINGRERWCLWLKGADPSLVKKCPQVLARIAGVREARLKSPTKSVRDAADAPSLFTQDRQPSAPYLAVPEVSSENRRYIPIGFLPESVVASNKLQIIVGGTLFHFGVLTSSMHMAWVRTVCGRLKSDYSYSPAAYNNFPWPVDPSEKDVAAVDKAAQAVLDARGQFPASTLADLYDPLTMPGELTKAHAALDRAVDRCYRREVFPSERARVEHLFALYERLAVPLVAATVKSKGRRGRAVAE